MTTTNAILRNRLFARERRKRGFVVCKYCGVGLTAVTATLDHVIPKSRGGTDAPSNLALACHACNNAKGDKLPGEPIPPPKPPEDPRPRAPKQKPAKRVTEIRLCDFCCLPGRLISGVVKGRPGDRYHPRCFDLAKRYAPVVVGRQEASP